MAPARHRAHRRRPPGLAAVLAVALVTGLGAPALASPLTVDELGNNGATPVAAPADIETEFGQLGFTGITPPPPEPEPEPEPIVAEPAPTPEPATLQGTGTVTTTRTEPATPTRSAARAPAPEPAPATPEPEPVAPSNSSVLGIAASYVGTPYVLGATGPGAFDCSGYTSYVYRQVGVSLPRTAAAQQAYATPVSNPRPGDLVFWGYPAYHVGIYAGNGMVFDAGSPGTGVIYRSVFSGVSGYGRVT